MSRSRNRTPAAVTPDAMPADATVAPVSRVSKTAMLSSLPDGAWRLKTAACGKLGPRSSGQIDYRIACNPTRTELYLSISGNSGGGYFSKEWLPVDRLAKLLRQLQADGKPFATKQLKPAFVGRSVNNPPFLAAILRAEQLTSADPANPLLSRVSGDIEAWCKALLKLKGEPLSDSSPAPANDEAASALSVSTADSDAASVTDVPAD